jgi:integrase
MGGRSLGQGGRREVRRVQKGPLTQAAHIEALLSAASGLSHEHWEVVTILLKTGIELEALSRVTWRDLSHDRLAWPGSPGAEAVTFPLDDPDLEKAVWSFIRRPRRSADQLDRLVRQARRAAGIPELAGVTALSLRLTRCLELLKGGRAAEDVSRLLAIKPAVVRQVARDAGLEVADDRP